MYGVGGVNSINGVAAASSVPCHRRASLSVSSVSRRWPQAFSESKDTSYSAGDALSPRQSMTPRIVPRTVIRVPGSGSGGSGAVHSPGSGSGSAGMRSRSERFPFVISNTCLFCCVPCKHDVCQNFYVGASICQLPAFVSAPTCGPTLLQRLNRATDIITRSVFEYILYT